MAQLLFKDESRLLGDESRGYCGLTFLKVVGTRVTFKNVMKNLDSFRKVVKQLLKNIMRAGSETMDITQREGLRLKFRAS
jgi:hypothetical protein